MADKGNTVWVPLRMIWETWRSPVSGTGVGSGDGPPVVAGEEDTMRLPAGPACVREQQSGEELVALSGSFCMLPLPRQSWKQGRLLALREVGQQRTEGRV